MAEYDEAYDESDLESDFEDLDAEASRRRRRDRGRWGGRRRPGFRPGGPAWQRPRPQAGSAAAALRREAEAGRARDRQLATAVNTTREDVGDVESQLRKANSDIARLRQISLVSLLLPRSLDVQQKRLTLQPSRTSPPGTDVLVETDAPVGPGVVGVV